MSIPEPQVIASAAETAVAEAEADTGREYLILKKVPATSPGKNPLFEGLGAVMASTTEQAVRKAADLFEASMNTDGPTILVAITTRSFSPQTVEVQVTRRVVVT
jgi:hypothetical protein